MTGSIQNEKELEFAIFCIENVAVRRNVSATEVFEALTQKSSILSDYIVKNYEILHTQGKEYIVDDIMEVVRERNVAL